MLTLMLDKRASLESCDVECWRYGVDKKRVAKAVKITEKASCEDNLAKQPLCWNVTLKPTLLCCK